jgi:hypothetical protein
MADTAAELDKATGQQQQEAAPRPVKRYRRAELDEEEERNKLLVPDDDDDGWVQLPTMYAVVSHAVCLPACALMPVGTRSMFRSSSGVPCRKHGCSS